MINIYVIKSEHLQNRWKSIDITVNKIGNLIQLQKMKYSVINITSPTVEEIEKNIADYNNQINLTEEVEDEDFKKLQSKFNLAQLSNLLSDIILENIIFIQSCVFFIRTKYRCDFVNRFFRTRYEKKVN